MRVKIEDSYAYPDIVIFCGDAKFEDNEFDTLTNPVIIMEILSDSTEAFDRGDKFAYYRAIPTLKEYILISQKKSGLNSSYSGMITNGNIVHMKVRTWF